MTDHPAPGAGASDDGRTDGETHETNTDGGRPAAVDRIEELEAENEALRERLDQLEAKIDEGGAADQAAGADQAEERSVGSAVSRRGTLAALAGAGVLGLGATGSASAQTSFYGQSDSGSSAGTGFEIDNNNTSDTFTFGIVGRAQSERARGVAGFADNSTGASTALFGRNTSTEGRAIRGFADATNGPTRGIQADCESPDGLGLLARNKASTGETVAIRGETSSPDGYGLATPDDARVDGTVDMSNSSSVPNIQFSSQGDAYMYMFESGTSNPDQNVISHSPGYPDWGLRYDDNGDDFVFQNGGTDIVTIALVSSDSLTVNSGNHAVSDGHVDAAEGYRGAVGSRAYLSSNFAVTSTTQTIPFDRLSADQRDEFDTSNNYFECAFDGTYAVDVGIEGSTTTTGNITLTIDVLKGSAGSNPADDQQLAYDFDGNGAVARTLSTTIYGLLAGNRISVTISSSDSLTLSSGEDETFISVRQVGGGGNYTSSPASTSAVVESPEGE